jgi:nicotinate-nucleotide adenylyltransferase
MAVENTGYFAADEREVRREGPTYTIDTLATFPDHEELVLIVGADAARGLATWHRASELGNRALVAVAPRPGVDHSEVAVAVGKVEWLDAPQLPISGTMIRQRISDGLSVRFLMPDSCWRYVMQQGLYR